MFCMKCQNDLADCTCPDLKERLEKLSQSPFLHIGPEYKKRIEKQADNTEKKVQE